MLSERPVGSVNTDAKISAMGADMIVGESKGGENSSIRSPAETMHQSAAVESITKELDEVYAPISISIPTTNKLQCRVCVFREVGQAYQPSISKDNLCILLFLTLTVFETM
jgi:hypothetical protein